MGSSNSKGLLIGFLFVFFFGVGHLASSLCLSLSSHNSKVDVALVFLIFFLFQLFTFCSAKLIRLME